jgi:predicted dithiol-disulfide oxidoreductase (DUF899 family)
MFGEEWAVACPGCASLADGLGGVITHVNNRDVTLLCMSLAPLEKLIAHKTSRGWTVPYVSHMATISCSTTASRSAGRRCRASSERNSRGASVYNTYRVYPHSRIVTPLFSGLLELLPNSENL